MISVTVLNTFYKSSTLHGTNVTSVYAVIIGSIVILLFASKLLLVFPILLLPLPHILLFSNLHLPLLGLLLCSWHYETAYPFSIISQNRVWLNVDVYWFKNKYMHYRHCQMLSEYETISWRLFSQTKYTATLMVKMLWFYVTSYPAWARPVPSFVRLVLTFGNHNP